MSELFYSVYDILSAFSTTFFHSAFAILSKSSTTFYNSLDAAFSASSTAFYNSVDTVLLTTTNINKSPSFRFAADHFSTGSACTCGESHFQCICLAVVAFYAICGVIAFIWYPNKYRILSKYRNYCNSNIIQYLPYIIHIQIQNYRNSNIIFYIRPAFCVDKSIYFLIIFLY